MIPSLHFSHMQVATRELSAIGVCWPQAFGGVFDKIHHDVQAV